MKKLLVLLAIFTAFSPAFAQYGGVAGFTYNTSQTMGESKEWIQDFSWRGFAVHYNYFHSDRTSVGVEMG